MGAAKTTNFSVVRIDEESIRQLCLAKIGQSDRFCVSTTCPIQTHKRRGVKFVPLLNHFYMPAGRLSASTDTYIPIEDVPRIHGLSDDRLGWWLWSGTCAECCLPVKPMEGISCANFCEPRGGWPACRRIWHARCYGCLGVGKFPLRETEDEMGNVWHKQAQRTQRINQGVRGAHASIPFQCEDCWMLNLEGRRPVCGLDDAFVMYLRRANLDAMGGRSVATIEAHASAIRRNVQNCTLMRVI